MNNGLISTIDPVAKNYLSLPQKTFWSLTWVTKNFQSPNLVIEFLEHYSNLFFLTTQKILRH
jgi:hypothetical protein